MQSPSDKFSIAKLIGCPSKESVQNLINALAEGDPLKHYTERSSNNENNIKDSYIAECLCTDNTHNRAHKGNSRTQIERVIMERALLLSRKETIELLSIGSGKLLQDLIIICKLINSGFKYIRINCVDPLFDANYFKKRRVLDDFQVIINAMTHFCNVNITCNFYPYINEIMTKSNGYDVVYAIDYNNLRLAEDYSSRNQPLREGLFTMPAYLAAMAIIKGMSCLKKNPKAFAAFSQGSHINLFAHSPNGFASENTIESFIYRPNIFKTYCINASIERFLSNLPFFIREQKPLWINDEIISETDKPFIEQVLNYFTIPYQFFNYASLNKEANNLINDTLTLIIDGISFDALLNETPELPGFVQPNYSIFRYDWKNKNKAITFPCHLQVQLDAVCEKEDNAILYQMLQALIKTDSSGMKRAQDIICRLQNTSVPQVKEYISQMVTEQLHALYKNDRLHGILNTPCFILELDKPFDDEKSSLFACLMGLTETDFSGVVTTQIMLSKMKRANWLEERESAIASNHQKNDYIKALTILNSCYYEQKTIYNNPNAMQTFFGMHNTLEWQALAQELRMKAWVRLNEIVSDGHMANSHRLSIIKHALTLGLFNEHRSNFEITKNTIGTFTVTMLTEMCHEIEARMEH